MSAAPTNSTQHVDRPAHRVTQLHVIRSEWTKLLSLRSTIITLLIAVILFIGLGILRASITINRWDHMDPREKLHFDAVNVALTGVFLAQLAIGVLGVLIVTGEYSTGMIRATFSAVPRRLPVLWAKLGVFAVISFVLMLITGLSAFFIVQSILNSGGHHLGTTLGSPGVARAMIGAAGYLTLIGMIGVGLGALIRNTAGAISTLAGVLFVADILVALLPQTWNDAIAKYLPAHAGESLFSVRGPDPTSLSPLAALALMIGYVVVIVGFAAINMRRRDA